MSQDIRTVLYSAYSYVRSQEANQSIATITLDQIIQTHINELKQGVTTDIVDAQGSNHGTRASRYDELDALEKQVAAMVQSVQSAGADPSKLSDAGLTSDSESGGSGE